MDAPEELSGGELNAAVSRLVTSVHTDRVGRGPRRSVSFHRGNVVVTLLEEAMTSSERTLARRGEGEAVLAMRQLIQRSMAEELKEQVGLLTGQEVVAFLGSSHLDPDLAVAVFVLDAEPHSATRPSTDQSLD